MVDSSNPAKADCIVVGGVAGGQLLSNVRMDMSHMELERPTHLKPIENSSQTKTVEVTESDVYEIHPLHLVNSNGERSLFGIAVVADKSLSWAFSQLVVGYVQNETNKLIAEDLKH